MRASLNWLRQHVALPATVTAAEVADAFIRVGLEVEAVHRPAETTGPLIVGRVKDIEELTEFKKPIRYAHLDLGAGNGPDGSDGPRGIICGARNFAVGDKVVVALPGTVLPGGFEIAARKTYGHISDGMICSARELGIGEDHDGIVVLDPDAEVGSDARSLIGADDAIIELSITPDRGYTLSIRGLARELSAAFDVPFTDPTAAELRPAGPGRDVRIEAADRCPRFVAVEVTGVNPSAPSPWFIRQRLAGAGIRSISLAVDVTNYVMVLTGHPLHAFDAAKLDGGIVVRRAHPHEKLRTLDGVDRVLADDDVVVADQSKALSIAGVMGGEESEITSLTTDIVIEAAGWYPPSISRTVRRHRLPSEAARRYERAVDPAISAEVAELAASLLVEYGGGQIGGRTDAGSVPPPATITMAASEPERLAGRYYTVETVVERLAQVGCTVDETSGPDGSVQLLVTPPTWRPDLTRPADLVEEVARLEGYDTIIPVLPLTHGGGGLTPAQRRRRRIADDLAAAGLSQVTSFPFMGSKDLDALGIRDDRRRALPVANPLDADRGLMATTLLPGLIGTALRNISRGAKDLALYEIGQVVRPTGDEPHPPALDVAARPNEAATAALIQAVPHQPIHLAAVICGHWEHSGWWGAGRAAEAADAFALARRVARTCGLTVELVAADLAPWHPGRCAAVTVAGTTIGHAGELHPAAIERLGLPARSLALELDLDLLPDPVPPVPPSVSPFPPMLIDVALVVDTAVTAGTVAAALRAGGGELVESVRLFDVYTGDQIDDDHRSLAFALVLRAPDRTLTGAEAGEVREAAIAAAVAQTGASLRA